MLLPDVLLQNTSFDIHQVKLTAINIKLNRGRQESLSGSPNSV